MSEPRPEIGQTSRARTQLAAHLRTPLYRNGYALALSGAATSAIGIIYWMITARILPSAQVGEGSAAVATMIFLSGLAQLNFRSALNRFLPVAGQATRSLVLAAYGLSFVAGLLLVGAFSVVARSVAPSLAFLFATPWDTALFWLAVWIWSLFVLQDSALTGLRRAVWVPLENGIFSISKILALLVLAAVAPAVAVFGSWFAGALLVVVPVNILLFRALIPRNAEATQAIAIPIRPSTVGRFVTGDYVGSLFVELSTSFLPALVITFAGPASNAYFYMAWQIAYSMNLAIVSMTTSLTVEASASVGELALLSRGMLRHILRLFVPITGLVGLAAPLILALLGPEYVEGGTTTLRLLALAAIPYAVNAVFLSTARVRRRIGEIVAVQAAICGIVLGLSFLLLPVLGIAGVGVAWLTGQTTVCVVLLVTRLRPIILFRVAEKESPADGLAVPAPGIGDRGVSGSAASGAITFGVAADERASTAAGTALAGGAALLQRAFDELDDRGIAWCLLRGDEETGPAADIDILVAPPDRERFGSALRSVGFVQLSAVGRGSHRFYLAYDPIQDAWLEIDAVTELAFGPGFALVTDAATACLSRRRRVGVAWELDPDDAFWALLLHAVLDKDVVDLRHLERLHALADAATAGGPLGARATGGEAAACRIVEIVRRGASGDVARLRAELTASLARGVAAAGRRRLWQARLGRVAERAIQVAGRSGITVALLGQDGVGKSTLVAGLTATSRLPVRTVYLGMWGGRQPRTRLAAVARIALRPAWIWWEWAGAQVNRALGRLVIFDRYTYDAKLPIRGGYTRIKAAYLWLLAHALPSPDLVVVLDAPAEVVFARKGESTIDELDRDRECFLAIASHLPSSVVIDATRTHDDVRIEVTARIWSRVAGRLRRRRRRIGLTGSAVHRSLVSLVSRSHRPGADGRATERARRILAADDLAGRLAAEHGWRVDGVSRTETGTTVVRLAATCSVSGLLKLPAAPAGAGSIVRHARALETLRDQDLGDLSSLLPEVLATGVADGNPYVIERLMPGRPGTAFPRASLAVIAAAAAAQISRLHRATEHEVVVDDDLLRRWIDDPAARLTGSIASGHRLRPAFASLSRRAADRLGGRRLRVGWIHGDLWAGNVLLAAPAGPVTGIVDWDLAEPDQLAVHDLLHLALLNRRLRGGGELGFIVRDLLEGGTWESVERGVFAVDDTGLLDDPGDGAIVLLLAWLRHVAALAPQPRHGDNGRWVRGNVEVVLPCL